MSSAPACRSTCACSDADARECPPHLDDRRRDRGRWGAHVRRAARTWRERGNPRARTRRSTARSGGRGVERRDPGAYALLRARRRPARRDRNRVGTSFRLRRPDRRARSRGERNPRALARRARSSSPTTTSCSTPKPGHRHAGTGISACCTRPRRRAWCPFPTWTPPRPRSRASRQDAGGLISTSCSTASIAWSPIKCARSTPRRPRRDLIGDGGIDGLTREEQAYVQRAHQRLDHEVCVGARRKLATCNRVLDDHAGQAQPLVPELVRCLGDRR